MALFNLFKKKTVPDELPSLATDEIEKLDKKLEKDHEVVNNHLKKEEKISSEQISVEEKVEEDPEEKEISKEVSKAEERSFFEELETDLNKNLDNLDGLEDWYKNKFYPQNVISDMRGYWENKKTESVLKILGKNFKERINTKTSKLQKLEKEWQNIYFDLIEKEEEIKDEEVELKKLLSEFVEICKRKKNLLSPKKNVIKKEKIKKRV